MVNTWFYKFDRLYILSVYIKCHIRTFVGTDSSFGEKISGNLEKSGPLSLLKNLDFCPKKWTQQNFL